MTSPATLDFVDQDYASLLALYDDQRKKIEYHKLSIWRVNTAYVAITAFLIGCLLNGNVDTLIYFGKKSATFTDRISPFSIIMIYVGFGFAAIAFSLSANEKINGARTVLRRVYAGLGEKFNFARGNEDAVASDKGDQLALRLSVLVPVTSIVIYLLLYLKTLLS